MMTSIKNVLLAGIAVTALMAGGAAHAETINGALARAYASSPDLNAQRASLRATDEQVPRAKSGYLPRVTASSSLGQANSVLSNISSPYDLTTTPRTVGVTVTQNLYNGDRTSSQVDAAEKGVLASRSGLRYAEQQVLLNGATQYMNVVRDEAVVQLRTANIDVLKEQLRQTQDRFNVGEVTRTDVAQVEAQLAAAEADRSSAEANLESSRAAYQQVIGVAPSGLVEAEPVAKRLPVSIEEAFKIGDAENPQLVASRINVEIAEAQVRLVEGEFKPSVDLQGSASQGWESKYPGDTGHDFRLLGQLSMPIYEAGEISARARAAKETLGQRRLESDSARDQVRSGVAAAWSQYETANARVKSAKAQIAAATIALNGVQEEAKVGQRTTLDVLISDQNLLSARVNLVTAQRDRVVSSYQLLAAVGRLSASNLGLSVKAYDPTAHYAATKGRITGTDVAGQ
ncbi:MAG: channel protein TolC [Alphaproteobacteria bacterium]|jgi:outer membrane protein|nr:channel protein TolC [Alphaproteobacteria bacterium]